jgi:rSAM/selenodomain-associated transferase 2
MSMLISVIIITLNEAENIEKTIMAVKNAAYTKLKPLIPIEIIVSDGGSNDRTVEIAKNLVDKVIVGTRGRYKQLNEGANASKGDILLFLHADTLLPKGGLLKIYYEMRSSRIVGGGFEKQWSWNPNLKFSKFLQVMNFLWTGFDNWSVRLLKTFPGDNAIFVRKSIYKKLNGFSPLWICEGLDFAKRLRRYKKKNIICIRPAVLTSTRRFEKYGFFKTIFSWFFIYIMWRLGMNQKRLKSFFNKYSTIPEPGDRKYLRF